MRAARSPFIVALLAVALAGCSSASTATGTAAPVTAAPTPSAGAPPAPGSPRSRGPARCRCRRVTCAWSGSGTDELALQFEFANNTDRPITPDTLGIDQIERIMMLVDLPRSTTYEMLTAQGLDGRLSESNGDDVPPGGVATVTAVFPAPPEEATELTVLIDGMLPAQVPVQPAGSPTLVDDPVLQASSEGEPRVGPVLCPAVGPADAGGTKRTVIRLPADVLFAFGSAELTPAAQGGHRRRRRRDRLRRHRHRDHRGAHRRHRQRRRTTRRCPSGGRRRCAPRWRPSSDRATSTRRSASGRPGRWRPTPSRTAATTRTGGR